MKVLITGELPFVTEVGELCLAAGHDTAIYVVEELLDAGHSEGAMPEAAPAEVVIELHNESATTKEALLAAVGRAVSPQALILTSVLPVSTTQAAAWLPHPERVVGIGLLPPLRAKGIIELAGGLQTAASALSRARQFWQQTGQETRVVGDGPGLVRARTVCCLINEAVSALQEGVATPADIDTAMKLGTNYPHGPLEWADLIGLDTVLGVMTGLYSEWGEDRYRPTPLLKRMVLAGKLGRKAGEGFYNYH
ncbi:MAG: 3-hydroxyacyl-CoA dehydrogenase family protein [Chloroflexota bacterium]